MFLLFSLVPVEVGKYSVFPVQRHGLNDNVKKVGNIPKNKDKGIVVWTLFNRHSRKFRKRSSKKSKLTE